ncbi:MAG: chemotaxis protein CheW, partial [Bryobacteraceae bacterium]
VYTTDHNAFNCSSKAVLNVARDSMARFGFSPATRVFEAAGAGACVLTDEWAGIDVVLEPDEEIIVVHNGEEVARTVRELSAERARSMNSREKMELIFLPGFSTAEKVSDVSGRGVGMDVVRSNLKKLNGVAELDSILGKGSRVTLRLPLTLAILPVLMVRSGKEVYALPLRSVVETLRVASGEVHFATGVEMLRLRDRVLPVARLRHIFRSEGQEASDGLLRVVVLGVGERRIGLVVDQLLGQEETVIKPLSGQLRSVPALAGATVSGDGMVRLILDPAGLAGMLENSMETLSGR